MSATTYSLIKIRGAPIGRLSASLPIIGIGHLTVGIGRLSADLF